MFFVIVVIAATHHHSSPLLLVYIIIDTRKTSTPRADESNRSACVISLLSVKVRDLVSLQRLTLEFITIIRILTSLLFQNNASVCVALYLCCDQISIPSTRKWQWWSIGLQFVRILLEKAIKRCNRCTVTDICRSTGFRYISFSEYVENERLSFMMNLSLRETKVYLFRTSAFS